MHHDKSVTVTVDQVYTQAQEDSNLNTDTSMISDECGAVPLVSTLSHNNDQYGFYPDAYKKNWLSFSVSHSASTWYPSQL